MVEKIFSKNGNDTKSIFILKVVYYIILISVWFYRGGDIVKFIEQVVNAVYNEFKIAFQVIIDKIGIYSSPTFKIQKKYIRKSSEYKGIKYTIITGEEYINSVDLLTHFFENRLDEIIIEKDGLMISLLNEKKIILERLIDSISEDMKSKIVDDFNSKIVKLDDEMIKTIEVFFECGLNLSESAKALYIHRNTLIYRLDKIQKVTSYDIREFNNAMIFKIIFLYIGRKKAI